MLLDGYIVQVALFSVNNARLASVSSDLIDTQKAASLRGLELQGRTILALSRQ